MDSIDRKIEEAAKLLCAVFNEWEMMVSVYKNQKVLSDEITEHMTVGALFALLLLIDRYEKEKNNKTPSPPPEMDKM